MRSIVLFFVCATCAGCLDAHVLPPAGDAGVPPPAEDAGTTVPTACETPDLHVASPASEAERVFNLALDTDMPKLERFVGQYARGAAPVYRGTFSADGYNTMEPGPVIASITTDEQGFWDGAGAATRDLTIFSPEQGLRVGIFQTAGHPDTTGVSIIVPDNSSFGVGAYCDGCLVDFLSAPPDTIDADLVATGEYGDGSPLRIEAAGHLERADPTTLDWDDIRALNVIYEGEVMAARSELVAEGGEMVRPVTATLQEEAAPREGFDGCVLVTHYTVEWFVDASCMVRYGLRDLEITSQQNCCYQGVPFGCTGETVCTPVE